MQIKLEPVTAKNEAAVRALSLHTAQAHLIEPIDECLAEAAADARWQPVGVSIDGHLVGFSMFGQFPSGKDPRGRVWFDRLLIDKRFQGKGYGRAAAAHVLAHMQAQYRPSGIYLSVYEDNTPAIALYQSLGFAYTGEKDTKGEDVMYLRVVKEV
ncbi:MAG: GNAT family N-acetyltransferase [Christensenellaceae bacterium]|jgi:diamine N-acetyltransferase